MQRRLAMMYGARLSSSSRRAGDNQRLTLTASFIDDRFALDGGISADCAALLCACLLDPMLENGLFRAADVEDEKRKLIESIESQKSDRMTWAFERFLETAGENEPFGANPIGTAETAAAITPGSVSGAWRELIAKSRIDVIAVGSLDFDGIFDAFAAGFSAVRREYSPLPGSLASVRPAVREVTETADMKQANLLLGYRMAELPPPDDYTIPLMNECFGGSVSSRLFLNVRERLSLCYYCSSNFVTSKGLLCVRSGLEPVNVGVARAEIDRQLADIAAGGLTEDEIGAARLSLTDWCRSNTDSVAAICEWYLRQLDSPVVLSPDEAAGRIAAVTPDALARAAASFVPDTVYVLRGAEEEGGEQA